MTSNGRVYLVEETWGRGWCVAWRDLSSPRGEVCLGEFEAPSLKDRDGDQVPNLVAVVRRYTKPAGRGRLGEFYWASKGGAARAMRVVRLALLESQEGRQWPSWAKQAIAEGWKPPKRWRPKDSLFEVQHEDPCALGHE